MHDVWDSLLYEYRLGDTLGSGAFATVLAAVHTPTSEPYAIKIVQKTANPVVTIGARVEAMMCMKLSHPNVVKVKDIMEDKDRVVLVMEILEGGSLQTKFQDVSRFSEEVSRMIFRNLLSAVQYLHSSGVCHRDIKFENVMLPLGVKTESMGPGSDKKPPSRLCGHVVLVDFGVAVNFKPGTNEITGFAGSLNFMAPEVLSTSDFPEQCYNEKVDMWSLGVLLYASLSGFFPFTGGDGEEIKVQVMKGEQIGFSKYVTFEEVSPEAKDLIHKLLTNDPSDRLCATDALQHPWLKKDKKDVANKSNNSIRNMSNLEELRGRDAKEPKVNSPRVGRRRGSKRMDSLHDDADRALQSPKSGDLRSSEDTGFSTNNLSPGSPCIRNRSAQPGRPPRASENSEKDSGSKCRAYVEGKSYLENLNYQNRRNNVEEQSKEQKLTPAEWLDQYQERQGSPLDRPTDSCNYGMYTDYDEDQDDGSRGSNQLGNSGGTPPLRGSTPAWMDHEEELDNAWRKILPDDNAEIRQNRKLQRGTTPASTSLIARHTSPTRKKNEGRSQNVHARRERRVLRATNDKAKDEDLEAYLDEATQLQQQKRRGSRSENRTKPRGRGLQKTDSQAHMRNSDLSNDYSHDSASRSYSEDDSSDSGSGTSLDERPFWQILANGSNPSSRQHRALHA